MAFKKSPGAETLGGPAEVIGLDGAYLDTAMQLGATFWPALVCGIALFVLILSGRERAAMAVAAILAAVQAWLLGWFG